MGKNNNTQPLVKFMNKKITVRMLEAHFNALPELLRYIIKQADTDIGARIALHNFTIESSKERNVLDLSEAVFGFAANLIQTGMISKEFKGALSGLALRFCEANDLGAPEEDWITRLNMVSKDD